MKIKTGTLERFYTRGEDLGRVMAEYSHKYRGTNKWCSFLISNDPNKEFTTDCFPLNKRSVKTLYVFCAKPHGDGYKIVFGFVKRRQ
tara:strand:+ start:149 stop:409 length:261 start_codon:yes stop_codon:yes gene_type:complete